MSQKIQRSFTSGEISPSLQSRADLIRYATGLNLCENFLVRAQGGVYSRPGFRFIGELDDQTKVARLIPFSFNTEQTYMLVFEQYKMRVIKDGGYVLSGGVPFELLTPFSETDLPVTGYTQSADVMTLVHPLVDPVHLNRLADDNWTMPDVTYAIGFGVTLATSLSLVISNITNANPAVVTTTTNHTIAAVRSINITGVVGMTEVNDRVFSVTALTPTTFELIGEDSTGHTAYGSAGAVKAEKIEAVGGTSTSDDKEYSYVVTSVDSDGVETLISETASIITPALSETAGVRLSWFAQTGSAYYRVYKDASINSELYGWIGDTATTSFDDYNIAPITSDSPPEDRQPFLTFGNKPSVVSYYQQRQIYANTTNEPQSVYTTQTNNHNSLRTSSPARDDDAVTFTIVAQQVNEIRHIVSLDSLLLLTSGGEWLVTEGQDEVLTPSTIGVRPQSYNGSSWTRPVVVDDTVLYVQERGTKIRDLFTNGIKYTGNDLSLMSEHLFDGRQIIEMAYADEPYGVLWCVLNDGQLLGLTYQRDHEIYAWHRHTTDGTFESVATIREDGRDAVYVIVKRIINGATKRYVERLEKREKFNSDDAFCVDSGLSYNGAAATVISGLGHLEGKAVAVLADGYEIIGKIVSSGSITLDTAASKVHVGLPYIPAIEMLDIDVASPTETLKPQTISVSEVVIEFEATRGGFVGPRKDPTASDQNIIFQEIRSRNEWDNYDQLALKTYKAEVVIEPQWSKGGGVRIEQRSPLPMAILSVIPKFDIGGS